MSPSRHPLKVGMHATSAGIRGTVVNLGHISTTWKGRTINSPTVDLSTPEGLLVNIPVRNLG